MDWTAELETLAEDLSSYGEHQPANRRGFGTLHHAALAAGEVSTKHKELIALAIGIAKQCSYCIGLHVKACIEAGASRAEIEETVNVSVMMGGGPALMYGAFPGAFTRGRPSGAIACPWGGASRPSRVALYGGQIPLPNERLARMPKAPARRDGQALALRPPRRPRTGRVCL